MSHSPKFIDLVDSERSKIEEVSVDEVYSMINHLDSLTILDVREESEVKKGRIAGAKSMGKGVIERDIEELIKDPDRPIVLYCGGGYRSVLAAASLQRMGYSNVRSMTGGWREWNLKEYPTES